jgi:hypothetical protein
MNVQEKTKEQTQDNLRTSELGSGLTYWQSEFQSKSIFGGVSVPGKNPGFAVVIATVNEEHFGSQDICLVDEFESFDLRQLIQKCLEFDLKYAPKMWIGDGKHDAADRFITEMNVGSKRQFSLTSTAMLGMENPYSYIIPQIKDLLCEDRRQLYLKNSKIINYLSGIQENEIAELELGDYPAIEALAFAVIEMRGRGGKGNLTKEEWKALKAQYGYDW